MNVINKFKFKRITTHDIYRVFKFIKSEDLGVNNINIQMIKMVLSYIKHVLLLSIF